jgi:hypothetical protein
VHVESEGKNDLHLHVVVPIKPIKGRNDLEKLKYAWVMHLLHLDRAKEAYPVFASGIGKLSFALIVESSNRGLYQSARASLD